tara:strand:- start:4 stop:513 length:510 start_codon:yes stop_codon:yes gene_type:complete
MIITCNNCSKKFDIDSDLIPEKGRLLQCSGCDHKWFFKKEVINDPIIPIKINNPVEETSISKKKLDSVEIQSPKDIELLDNPNKDDTKLENNLLNKNEDLEPKLNSSKNKKNYNILGITIVFIITFIALIILLDTFQIPIGKIVPDIEFLLYNLYETINDIKLFLTDLI